MASILCNNGPEHRHSSVQESRQCWAGVRPANASAAPGVTTPPTVPPAATPYALQPRTSVPLPMLEATPDGYFAVRVDDNDAYRFLRISRKFPKHSKKIGCVQVQSQHSDDLKPVMMYRPLDSPKGSKEWLWVATPRMERYVILAMVDPLGTGLKYAQELGRCCICGKTLTDERSRHYGIGPECEKVHPERIAYIDGLNSENDL
jgi:hypothetical protein